MIKTIPLFIVLFTCFLLPTSAVSVRSHNGPTELPAGAVIMKENLYFFPIAVATRPRDKNRQTVTVTLRVGSDFELRKGFNWPSNWTLGSDSRYFFVLISEDKEIRATAQTNVLSVLPSGTSRNIDITFAVDNDLDLKDFSIRFVGRSKKDRITYEGSTPLAPFI